MVTPLERRDEARPVVPSEDNARATGGPDDRSDAPAANTNQLLAVAKLQTDLSPRQKRLASKAVYRAHRSADVAFREVERERAREWRRKNPDKTRAQKNKARSINYHRPFVAIDSEGQDYPGDDVVHDGVRYRQHGTYLWGAAADESRAPTWLTAAATQGKNKPPLNATAILDWLLGLPLLSGPCIFVMFSFGYDVTQVLRHLPFKAVWEIEKRTTCPDEGDGRPIGYAPVFWRDYAISYTKGKSFEIWRLRDPEKPFARTKPDQGASTAPPTFQIDDVFGFFQSSFSAVAKSMVDSGRRRPKRLTSLRR